MLLKTVLLRRIGVALSHYTSLLFLHIHSQTNTSDAHLDLSAYLCVFEVNPARYMAIDVRLCETLITFIGSPNMCYAGARRSDCHLANIIRRLFAG